MTPSPLSRRTFLKTTALSLPLIAAAPAMAQTNSAPAIRSRRAAGDFVRVRDGRFELRGRPYCYVGANVWYGCYLSDAALPGGRERFIRELDRLKSIGVDNLRLLAGSETSPL